MIQLLARREAENGTKNTTNRARRTIFPHTETLTNPFLSCRLSWPSPPTLFVSVGYRCYMNYASLVSHYIKKWTPCRWPVPSQVSKNDVIQKRPDAHVYSLQPSTRMCSKCKDFWRFAPAECDLQLEWCTYYGSATPSVQSKECEEVANHLRNFTYSIFNL